MMPDTIRSVRNSLGLTQSEFGQLLGAHSMTVSRWELGQLAPSAYQQALMEAFQTASRNRRFNKPIKTLLVGAGIVAVLAFLLSLSQE